MKTRSTLAGRIVTMDAGSTVLDTGALYVDAGRVVAVGDAGAPRPAGFESVATVATGDWSASTAPPWIGGTST